MADDLTPEAEAQAYAELVQMPGWQLFVATARQEWGGEGYGRKMRAALASVPPGPDRPYEVARVAERIDDQATAINNLLSVPAERIKAVAATVAPSRPFEALRRLTR